MTFVSGLLGFVVAASGGIRDSSTDANDGGIIPLPSPLHVMVSTFGTLGSYSTGTKSRSLSGFATLSNAWVDYYTIGYGTLWLERDDAGGKYYTQHLVAARASKFLPPRITLAGHYAYLDEGEIQLFSERTNFHWMGGGASYWFSPFQVAGSSFTLSLSGGEIATRIVRGYFSFEVTAGIWSTTTAIASNASWTPSLFWLHQTVSIPFGGRYHFVVSGGIGRRAFYLDDETLVLYNQRVVQTRLVQAKAVVNIVGGFYVIPSFEYNGHDEYSATYGSLGLRLVF
ncbi:MAG: hypothetical protein KF749_11040 [Bacteroidetes bacterium]|nr:hypothetical protein [Bacteroidota bacterium]MCW5895682.1 hypothetical protein [Bacteroidota bacterium]